jgi:hypothetical protein
VRHELQSVRDSINDLSVGISNLLMQCYYRVNMFVYFTLLVKDNVHQLAKVYKAESDVVNLM